MKTLLITEKYSVASALCDSIDLSIENCDIFCVHPHHVWRYKLKKISFEQVPFVGEPPKIKNLLDGNSVFVPSPLHFIISGQSVWAGNVSSLVENVEILKSNLASGIYDQVICLGDSDPIGQLNIKRGLELVEVPDGIGVSLIKISTLDPENLKYAFSNRSQINDSEFSLVSGQLLKNKFDYWWNSNSAIVLSEAAKFAGLEANPVISKYEALLMQHLGVTFKNSKFFEPDLIRMMHSWVGTGKFKGEDFDYWYGLVSVSERSRIVKQMQYRGFLSDSNGGLSITDKGRDFLRLLHPRSLDLDLPFRVEAWRTGEGGGEATAKRYIRTFFGRQLRHQRKEMNKIRVEREKSSAFKIDSVDI
ncbi:hypothetical protein QTV49_004772 [Vibrio vulnificus]|nr:hypothetical protein [Vibrio vulnificus]